MRQKSLFTGFIVDNFWLFRMCTVFMLKILFFLHTFCPKACIPQPNRVLYYYKKSREPKEVYLSLIHISLSRGLCRASSLSEGAFCSAAKLYLPDKPPSMREVASRSDDGRSYFTVSVSA